MAHATRVLNGRLIALSRGLSRLSQLASGTAARLPTADTPFCPAAISAIDWKLLCGHGLGRQKDCGLCACA
eukprot:scaffold78342_cov26-Tisochrysis_lutea.AAC.2